MWKSYEDKKLINEPRNKPLTNLDIIRIARKEQIPDFRGIFMRDELPEKPWRNERLIINLDRHDGPGTHWTALRKEGKHFYYFDSYGNLPPPKEVINYLPRGSTLAYNYCPHQKNATECGHLSIEFLLSTSPPDEYLLKNYKYKCIDLKILS